MLGELLDKVISVPFPRWGATRMAYRHQAAHIAAATSDHQSMRQMLGSSRAGGYEAGKTDRLKGRTVGSPRENDIPRQQIHNLRWRSWNLYRNCPQARKISRNLGAKVIGRGLTPQPQATTVDGDPHVDFRRRARKVWSEFIKECDWRGKPGSGGQPFVPLSKTALRAAILSGGLLYRFHHLTLADAKRLGLYVPLQIQLMHIDRLDEQQHGDGKFYGLELDERGIVTKYHILRGGPKQEGASESTPIPASEMRHLFVEEDIDQLIGSPWLNAALLTMDDRRNYEYSELVAAEMASCLVAGFRRSPGQVGGIGLKGGGTQDRGLVDADGNPITRFQPGMVLDLGHGGELQMVNPARPSSNAGEFLGHLIRSEAVSVPGIKSSTLTGDYRASSFSSERSADNDVWPEIEEIQDWFALGFCQPIYEAVIKQAVVAGLFDDVEGFSKQDFAARTRDFLATNWQGPVPRSINPRDDAEAARVRVKAGTSTPQREAAQTAQDWREVLQEIDEYIDYAEELEIPPEIYMQALGVEKAATPAAAPVAAPAADPPRPSEQQQDEDAAAARLRQTGFHLLNRAPQ